MKLTKLQEQIINAPEKRIVVEASAAAAKTSTLIEKVRSLLQNGVSPTSICVITYTRMAASELIERLGDDYKDGLFVGTIHALAATFLNMSHQYSDIQNATENGNFDDLFLACKENSNCIIHYPILLLDEGQDSGEKELEFIFDLIDPVSFFVFLDYKQCIYVWKGSCPDLVRTYMREKNATTYYLNENFRNGSKILEYARKIIEATNLHDNSICKRGIEGRVVEVDFDLKQIVSLFKTEINYNSWAILVRTNKQLDDIKYALTKNEIPCNTFKQGDLTREEMLSILKENKVKILTIHSSKGLEFDNVIVVGAVWWGEDSPFVNYVAATRARNILIWTKEPKKKKTTKKYSEDNSISDWE